MVNIQINPIDYQRLRELYGNDFAKEVVRVTKTFTQRIQRDARENLVTEGKVDSGALINSIKEEVRLYNAKVIGQVYSGTKYARFIHEGAKHEGTEIVPFFVSFQVAPSLRQWAIRKGVLYQKRKDGQRRRRRSREAPWYMTSQKTGKEYRVDIKKGGLKVNIQPTLFLEKPFERYKEQYLRKVQELVR